jgi:sortase B
MNRAAEADRKAIWDKRGIKVIHAADSVVNTALILIVLLLLAIGGYALWDANQVYNAADSARYEVYKPGEEEESLSFGELVKINPDVFAWLTVYGTHIDYPVAQGKDNMTYVNTDAKGHYSLSGSIFLDKGCKRDFSDFSSILYGHHMDAQKMFGEIGLFADKSYFDAREYGSLYYGGEWHGLEFFAFLHADAYDSSVFRVKIEGKKAQEEYLAKLLNMSEHTRDIGVTTKDRIVLLSTCSPSPTNGRDILVGRITDDLHANAFAISDDKVAGSAVDALGRNWLWILLGLLVAAAILAVIIGRRKKRKDEEKLSL